MTMLNNDNKNTQATNGVNSTFNIDKAFSKLIAFFFCFETTVSVCA